VKKILIILLSLVFSGVLSGCTRAVIAHRPEGLRSEALNFEPPTVTEWREPSGLTVLFIEDNDLPLIEGELYLPGGSLNETSADKGITSALFDQMRSGGVKGISAKEFDKKLDGLAASIGTEVGSEFGSFSFLSHRDDFEETLTLLAKMLQTPSFEEGRLELYKAQSLDSIKRRRESADAIAALTYSKALYGDGSPYGESTGEREIRALSRARLLNRHRETISPDGAILAISGNTTESALKKILSERLASWNNERLLKGAIPTPTYRKKPGIYVVESRFEQVGIILGGVGPRRLSPDHFKLSVFNRYFSSGSFGSVLFSEIRSKRGLAYTIDGGFAPGPVAGEFIISLGTRSSEAMYALTETLKLIEGSKEKTADPKRLAEIKDAAERSFVFNFASSSGVLERAAQLKLLGFPSDFNRTYIPNIRAITRENLLEVSNRYLDLSQMVIVVVGNVNALEIKKLVGDKYHVYGASFDTSPKIGKEVVDAK